MARDHLHRQRPGVSKAAAGGCASTRYNIVARYRQAQWWKTRGPHLLMGWLVAPDQCSVCHSLQFRYSYIIRECYT